MNQAFCGTHSLIASPLWTDGLLSTMSFSPEEEEELESGGSAELTTFSEDLVAEQLTYMDAVGLPAGSQMPLHLPVGGGSTVGPERAAAARGMCYESFGVFERVCL